MQDSPPTAGDRLLSFFDSDPVTASEKLLRCRQKLIRRFSAERCHDPEDLANETLRRVLDALNKNPLRLTTAIEHFISGFARNIIHEDAKHPRHKEDPLDEMSSADEPQTNPLDALLIAFSEDKNLLRCLKLCLEQFNPQDRSTLIQYYSTELGEKAKTARRDISSRLGLTSRQLIKRAYTLRVRLELLTKRCLEGTAQIAAWNKTKKLS